MPCLLFLFFQSWCHTKQHPSADVFRVAKASGVPHRKVGHTDGQKLLAGALRPAEGSAASCQWQKGPGRPPPRSRSIPAGFGGWAVERHAESAGRVEKLAERT